MSCKLFHASMPHGAQCSGVAVDAVVEQALMTPFEQLGGFQASQAQQVLGDRLFQAGYRGGRVTVGASERFFQYFVHQFQVQQPFGGDAHSLGRLGLRGRRSSTECWRSPPAKSPSKCCTAS